MFGAAAFAAAPFFNLTVDKDPGIIYNSLSETALPPSAAAYKNSINRGVAQLVGRLLWEHRRHF